MRLTPVVLLLRGLAVECVQEQCIAPRTDITGQTHVDATLMPNEPLYFVASLAVRYYSYALTIKMPNSTSITLSAVPTSLSGVSDAVQQISTQSILTTARLLLLNTMIDDWEFQFECISCPEEGASISIDIQADGMKASEYTRARGERGT